MRALVLQRVDSWLLWLVALAISQLALTASAQTAPVFTSQPSNVSVADGGSFTVNVQVATSNFSNVTWKVNVGSKTLTASSTASSQINNLITASVAFGPVGVSDSGTFQVVATNDYGSTLSAQRVLSVTAVAPSISVQPAGLTVLVGGAATLSVTATGSAPLTFQWRKNGTVIPGATSASLTFATAQTTDAGSYTVVITNSVSSVTSNVAALAVSTAVPPTITTQPIAQSISTGANTSFSVGASGATPLNYQWRKDGVNIVGATTSMLTLTNVQPANIGDYSVVVSTGLASVTSSSASLAIPGISPGLWKNLVAYYTFNGNSNDQSGYGNSATPAGNFQFTSGGLSAGGLRVIGDNSQLYAGGGHVLLPTFGSYLNAGFSLSFWVKDEVLGRDPAGEETYISFGASDGPVGGINLDNNNGRVVFFMNNSVTGTSLIMPRGPSFDTAAWKQLVLTYTPGKLVGYFNGQKISESSSTIDVFPVTLAALGRHWWNGGATSSARMSATYDNVRIYARTLSDADVQLLYDSEAPPVPPTLSPIVALPTAQGFTEGQSVTLSVTAAGTAPFSYQWSKDGTPIVGATSASLVLNAVKTTDAGSYTVVVSNAAGIITSVASTLVVTPFNPGRLINLSILTDLTAAVQTFTVGTVIGGSGTSGIKPLLVRAAGPSLAQLGVGGPLPDPKLDLFSGQTVVATNDDWGGSVALSAAMTQVGAFPYASTSSKDSAIYNPAFASGGYTVQVSGNGTNGTVIAEIYDATPPGAFTAATPRLVNVSVLKQIGSGGLLTLGFTVGGSTTKTVLIRAIGPALGLAPFNIAGAMVDPQLTLFNGGSVAIKTNNDWGGDPQVVAAITATGAFPVANTASKDAMLVMTLAPGGYTAQASGVGGTGGFAIVEIYEVP